jgi:hypothetical protein
MKALVRNLVLEVTTEVEVCMICQVNNGCLGSDCIIRDVKVRGACQAVRDSRLQGRMIA